MTLRYTLDMQPGLTTVLAETTGAITTRYIHGPTGIHAQQNADGGWRWLLQDGLQSVRAVANGTDVVAAQQYSPYGVPVSAMTETDFGFTGELTDDNDLVYLRARYLNPAMGVFAGLDPFEGDADTPLTLNGYGWVESNPINLVDASGMASMLATSCEKASQLSGLNIPRVSGCWTLADYATDDCPGSGAGEGVTRGSRGGGAAGVGVPVVIVTERIARLLEAAKTVAQTVIGAIRAIDLVIDIATGTAGARNGPWGGRAQEAPAIPRSGERAELDEKSNAQESERDKAIPIPYNDRVDPDCHPITWPQPIWMTLGINDPGAINPDNNKPTSTIITKVQSPDRNTSARNYREKNAILWGNIPGIVHHKWPLFLGGPDSPDNLVFLPLAEHASWHRDLYSQGKTGYMLNDPNGTKYCVS